MKLLVICSGTKPNFNFKIDQVFIYEQLLQLEKQFNVEYDLFLIQEKGLKGYLRSIVNLYTKIRNAKYDFIHAFYGLSCLVSVLQFQLPVISTFLGSDIHNINNRIISFIASKFSRFCIFMNNDQKKYIYADKKGYVIPFGINLNNFYPLDKVEARKNLNLDLNNFIILVPSFKKKVKNFQLAENSILSLSFDRKIEFVELYNNYTTEEMNLLYNSADVFLMTSLAEGSPQTIKEAMACNCPIISTDVGNVREIIEETDGCYLALFNPSDISAKIKKVYEEGCRTKGRQKIQMYDNKIVAEKIFYLYKRIA